MTEYPRILISGQYFHTNSGGGITLSNLFSGWDKENIAVAASYIANPSFEICDNYYQLGSSEFKLRFPFNLKKRSNLSLSGKVLIGRQSLAGSDIYKTNKSFFRKLYDKFLFASGLIHYRSTFIISPEFIDWIRTFNPEIIYSQLSSLEEIRIVAKLKNTLDVPLAIHIMDDWPSTISDKYFPRFLWKWIIQRELRRLFSKAKILLSISDPMSEEYFYRYGLNFLPFHNPIDLNIWMAHIKNDSIVNEKDVRILYSGRIGIGISQSLVDVAEAIDPLNFSNNNIRLYIQTPTEEHEILERLRKYRCVIINPIVDYSQIPEIFSNADMLLLVNDFDDAAVTFLKFSMPTKASEYMISGTPVLVYSAEETAVTKFFIQNECGYCVTHRNKEELTTGITKLIHDKAYRNKISRNAVKVALEKFDAVKVRNDFRKIFISAVENS